MPEYIASATAKGARAGHVRSDNGRLDLDLAVPEEFGGPGGAGTNPEELFAAGYAACFQGALAVAGGKREIDTSESEVTARVHLTPPDMTLSVELEVMIPGVDEETTMKLTESAHRVCPYSRATRDNIEVTLSTRSA
ncbi:MAG: peroxiredoxin, Ohr subfamily [Solirubrobacterales bacterium]|jgi:osmotically inducible protein OsmC|nr:peroxiredoxin, Ohr subfamily [Solirubrobacterales bacterium]